jgi:TRAP-type C4-dicarboxylate transport system permease small subunit
MTPIREILFSLLLASFGWAVWRIALTGRLPGDAVPEDETDRRLTFLFLGALGLGLGLFAAATPFGLLPRVLGASIAIGAAVIVWSAARRLALHTRGCPCDR